MAKKSRTAEATNYIKANFEKKTKEKLIKKVSEKFNLKESGVKVIYALCEESIYLNMKILADENREKREREAAKKKEEFFKGRKRQKIAIDDTKLFAMV
ncbi:hypothetical protein [Clostridium sp. HBUAS56017]|uniref:hypothetical protein n=1 Tax=Clostridium sp. HBUAS56017 TaxID=2571128 RepID=UPI0011786B43|nr:hypothetical protein [Clostridium sp. HBUAS56017]